MAAKAEIVAAVAARIKQTVAYGAGASASFDIDHQDALGAPITPADTWTLRHIRAGLALTLLYETAHLISALWLVPPPPASLYFLHFLDIVATAIAFGLTCTSWCRQRWRELVFVECSAMVISSVVISALTAQPIQFFVAAVLLQVGAAALVPWGPRWQAALTTVCLCAAVAGSLIVRPSDRSGLYLWMELVAAAGLAQFVATLTQGYRREIDLRIEALEANEARLWNIFDANPDAIAVARVADHRFINVSREFLKSGFSRDEAVGATDLELGIWSDDAKHRDFWQRLQTRRYVRNLQAELRIKDGSLVPCMVSGVVTELSQGPCVIWVIRNIAALKRTELELVAARKAAEAASRAKSDFLSSMAHEIRTPMNAILGMSELLADSDLGVEQRKYLNIMMNNGSALLDLINDILDLARIESGRLTLEQVPFDLQDLAERVAETFSIRAHQKGLELAVYIAPDTPAALIGDPLRLRQVLVNLIGNAIKFTDDGEIVVAARLEAGSDPAMLHFTVSDTGIGIAPDKRESIFASYTQAGASTARMYGGTGLGLTIVTQLVELMGGSIWVESAPGCGSTFHFTASFSLDAKAEVDVERNEPDLKGARILLVDHAATNRVSIAEVLAARGALMSVAGNAEEALARIHEATINAAPFDLVLLDCRMPGTNALELVKRMRAERLGAGTVVPMLTADDLNVRLPEMRRAGLVNQLIKPIRRAELFDAIKTVFDGAPNDTTPLSATLRDTANDAFTTEAVAKDDDNANNEAVRSTSVNHAAGDFIERPLRVLVADDSADNRILIEAFLKKVGWHLDQAENGEEAVGKFIAGRYDVVLMDIQMPVMDGYTAVRRIREWERTQGAPHTPIIALTASVLDEAVSKSLAAGCDTHVSKPFRRPALLATIRDVVAQTQEDCADTTDGRFRVPIGHSTGLTERCADAAIGGTPLSRIH